MKAVKQHTTRRPVRDNTVSALYDFAAIRSRNDLRSQKAEACAVKIEDVLRDQFGEAKFLTGAKLAHWRGFVRGALFVYLSTD